MKTKFTILAIFFATLSFSQSIVSVTPDTITAGGVTNTINIVGNLTFWNTGAGIYYVKLIRNSETLSMFSLDIIDDTHVECTFFVPTAAENGCYDVQAFDLVVDTVTLVCGMTVIGGVSGITDKANDANRIELHPNPLTHHSTLKIISLYKGMFKLDIFNSIGSQIKTIMTQETEIEINREDFKTGMYFYILHNEEGHISSGKIVVQ